MRIQDFWPEKGIEETVAMLLNGDPRCNDVLDDVVQDAQSVAVFIWPDLPQFGPQHQECFMGALRILVNDWIDSGKECDGVEDPWARKHPAAPIDEYWQHAKPFVSCDRDGRVSIRFLSGYNARDLSSWSRNLAIGYFIRLLDSPERERLSQCVTCARYFVRERMPKQHAPIKRGSYCKFHRYQRKARSVEAIRAERKGRMLVLAARMAAEYQLKKPREDRSEWIANKMNREIRRSPKLYQWDRTITRKWVTQNEAGIERRQARDRPGG